jgi:hypothetical protein
LSFSLRVATGELSEPSYCVIRGKIRSFASQRAEVVVHDATCINTETLSSFLLPSRCLSSPSHHSRLLLFATFNISFSQKLFHLKTGNPSLNKDTTSSGYSEKMVSGPFHSGPASSFPGRETWKEFIPLFNTNKPEMFQTGDSGEDVGRIFNAITEAAKIGVEERVILAIIMQESTGNVGVPSTTDQGGQGDAGLMQCRGSPGFPGQYNLSQVRTQVEILLTSALTNVVKRTKSHPW